MIKDSNNKEMSEAKVLQIYFGRKEGQSVQGFMEELRALTPAAKTEMAKLAAKELGLIVE